MKLYNFEESAIFGKNSRKHGNSSFIKMHSFFKRMPSLKFYCTFLFPSHTHFVFIMALVACIPIRVMLTGDSSLSETV